MELTRGDWRIVAVGDQAVSVGFADPPARGGFDPERHARLLALDDVLGTRPVHGVVEVQPALVNLLVRFDPSVTDHEEVAAAVIASVPTTGAVRAARATHRVDVCHDPSVAPDLPAVATQAGMTVDEVVGAQLGAIYEVLMYGFAPGYAYLGGLPERLAVPRKPAAVRDVPRGSVIIAGGQCLVTTVDMPTGWWVIGRSPTALVSEDEDRPFPMGVGDLVEFRSVGLDSLAPVGEA